MVLMPVFDATIYGGGGGGGPYTFTNTEAETLVNAMTTEPNDTRKGHIDDLVGNLKSGTINSSNNWAKLDALWLMAAADSQAARLNWKSPSTFTLTELNSPTFVTDRGYQMNAATDGLDTGWDHVTDGVQHVLADASYGYWVDIMDTDSGTNMMGLTVRYNIFSNQYRIQNFGFVAHADTTTGLHLIQSTGMSSNERYNDTTLVGTGSNGNQFDGTGDSHYIGTANNNNSPTSNGSDDARFCMAFFGSSFSTNEIADFHDAIETYLSAVGVTI